MSGISALNSNTRAILKDLQTYDVSKLERAKDLGRLAFKNGSLVARKIQSIALQINAENLDDLPNKALIDIAESCREALHVFGVMNTFTLSASNPELQHKDITDKLEEVHSDFFNVVTPYISYLNSISKDALKEKSEIAKIVNEVVDRADKTINESQSKLEEANALIEALKNASAEGGTLEQAKYFGEEKIYHQERAKWWSVGTAISAFILLAYTFLSINLHSFYGIDLSGAGKEALAIQVTSTKILIFAVLGYMLVLSVRNFMSHKHNMVVNSHREVALHTFEALAKASNQDEGARDIILNHAASCIFSPQDTGYVKFNPSSEGGGLAGSSFILNMMKKSNE